MRLTVAFLAALAAVQPPAAPAAAQPVRTVAPGTHIDWSSERDGSPVRYRVGDVHLTLRGTSDSDMADLVRPVLSVSMPGMAAVQVEGADTPPSFDHRVTVGRWDTTRPYVLFQSYSGGAHCCTQVTIVYPEGARLRVVDLGEWDSGYWDALPVDRNGDGRLDFEFVDNAFLYAFASYADSWAPPKILNIVGGEAVDVSTEPAFRRLFEAEMERARRACTNPEDDRIPNGACAAYVASAARVGQFDRAWAEMLRSYDRDFEWTLPAGCRAAVGGGPCPDGQQVEYDNYPDALRAFLIDLGYIER